jgi:hypothetical protein
MEQMTSPNQDDSVPTPDEARGLAIMREAGARLIEGVQTAIGPWAVRVVAERIDAWGNAPAATRTNAVAEAAAIGLRAAERVAGELGALLALDPEAQRATPLEIVRSAVREPTEVLRSAGVPEVVRDDFAERAWPHDVYALVPNTLADLGDEELAPLHVAWGVGKATVIKARRAADEGPLAGPDEQQR